MVKNICLFNLNASVNPDAFWREQLEKHARNTLLSAGDLLVGYVLNRSLSAISGRIPYTLIVELWFRDDTDRDRFLEIAGASDDGFDDQVVGMSALAVDEVVMRAPPYSG